MLAPVILGIVIARGADNSLRNHKSNSYFIKGKIGVPFHNLLPQLKLPEFDNVKAAWLSPSSRVSFFKGRSCSPRSAMTGQGLYFIRAELEMNLALLTPASLTQTHESAHSLPLSHPSFPGQVQTVQLSMI